MNAVFLALPLEKQQRIINAGLEVFSKYDYKKANTEDIANLANISKGSLFYYFKNKREFYLYLYNYVTSLITKSVLDEQFKEITDFFELLEYVSRKKATILIKNPYILEFIMQYFYLDKEALGQGSEISVSDTAEQIFLHYCQNIDFHKFKGDINPKDIYKMMVWIADGYLHEKRKKNHRIDVNELMVEFQKWQAMFKSIAYKEKYQNEQY